MFFVVHAIDIGAYFVIPREWIQDFNFEKVVNWWLNSQRKHVCYYTTRPTAWDNGVPVGTTKANFHSPIQIAFPCYEGTYLCKLKRFFVNYDDAVAFSNWLRPNVPPIIYNEALAIQDAFEPAGPPYAAPMANNGDIILDGAYGPIDHNLEIKAEAEEIVASAHDMDEFASIIDEDDMAHIIEMEVQEYGANVEDVTVPNHGNKANFAVDESDDADLNGAKDNLLAGNQMDEAVARNDEINKKAADDVVDGTVGHPPFQNRPNEPIVPNNNINEKAADADGHGIIGHPPVRKQPNEPIAPNDKVNEKSADAVADETVGHPPFQNKPNEPIALNAHLEGDNLDAINNIDNHANKARENHANKAATSHHWFSNSFIPGNEPNDTSDYRAGNYSDDEEISFKIVEGTGFPKPFQAEDDAFVKREDDPFSGDLPFNELDDGRMYKCGTKKVLIPKTAVEKFLQWNTYPFYMKECYDQKLVQALLIKCVGLQQLSCFNVDGDTRQFIYDLLCVRVKGDQARLEKLNEYIQLYCNKLNEQQN